MVQRFDLDMSEPPERTQRRSGSIKGERTIEHQPMLSRMVFGSITMQIVKLKLNEARWDCIEELRGKAQRVGLAE